MSSTLEFGSFLMCLSWWWPRSNLQLHQPATWHIGPITCSGDVGSTDASSSINVTQIQTRVIQIDRDHNNIKPHFLMTIFCKRPLVESNLSHKQLALEPNKFTHFSYMRRVPTRRAILFEACNTFFWCIPLFGRCIGNCQLCIHKKITQVTCMMQKHTSWL